MRLKFWISLIPVILLALTACGLSGPAALETFAVTETKILFTATQQPSLTPRILLSSLTPEVSPAPTETPTPTLKPAPTQQTFVREGTQLPPSERITAANAGQLVELARLGKGAIADVQLSPDRNFLLVQTSIGVYGWLADSQLEMWGFEDPTGIAAMALPQLARWMAVATNDGQIALLIYQRGSMFTRWASGHSEIYDLAFSYDDNLLAVVGDQGVTVWQVGETEPLNHYPNIQGTAIRFTPDDESLIVRSEDYTTHFYSLSDGEGQKVAGTSTDWVWEFSRDGSYLTNGEKLWDGRTGEFLFNFNSADYPSVAFSYDSRYIAVNNYHDEFIYILRTSDGEEVFALRSPYSISELTPVNSGKLAALAKRGGPGEPNYFDLAFSPDGKYLAASTSDDTVEIWDLQTGIFEGRSPGLGYSLLFRKNSRLVIWGYNSMRQIDPLRGIIMFQDRDFNSLRYDQTFIHDPIAERRVLFSEEGEWVIAENVAWHVPEGVRTYRLGGEAALAVDRNGEYIYTFDNVADTVRKRRVGNFSVVYEVELLPPFLEELGTRLSNIWIENMSISPDGRFLSGYIYDYGLTIWDLDSGETIDELHGGSFTYGSEFSPDTQYLYVCGDDELIIYQLDTYQQVFTLEADYRCDGDVYTFTRDGRFLLINENGIKGYQVSTDHLEKMFQYDQNANNLAISPYNSMIAISEDSRLLLLEFDSGDVILELDAHNDEILDISFSADGRYIATSSWDGTVRIWGIPVND
jgi:WD40 repeat protein